jgi:mycothiol system anti-sigma-R factor
VNCREALAKLYDYLDKELNEEDSRGLERHLEHCSDCLKKYELEEEFNSFIKEKTCCQPDVSHLKNRVREEIDRIDSSQPRNILYLIAPLAIAAVISLVIFVPWSKASDPQAVLAAVRPLADEHTKCLDGVLTPLVKSNDPIAVKAAMEKLGELPDELFKAPASDYSIEGGSVMRLPSGEDARIEYKVADAAISVFVLPKGTIDKKPFRTVKEGDEVYYVGSCPYYHYVIWTCDNRECVAVSKLDPPKLLAFSENF